VLSRVLAGARVTVQLGASLLVRASRVLVGGLLGLAAGFFGRWGRRDSDAADRPRDGVPHGHPGHGGGRVAGRRLVNAVLAALVVSWPAYAGSPGGWCLGVREGRLRAGRPLARLLRRPLAAHRHRADGDRPVLIHLASLNIGTATLLLPGLLFLGLGAKPPTAEWAPMVATAINHFDAWWMGVFPGLAILTVVMAFNFLGDAMRDALDPRTAGVLTKAETRYPADLRADRVDRRRSAVCAGWIWIWRRAGSRGSRRRVRLRQDDDRAGRAGTAAGGGPGRREHQLRRPGAADPAAPAAQRHCAAPRSPWSFQDPSTSLHPMLSIGAQLTDHLRHHRRLDRASRARAGRGAAVTRQDPRPGARPAALPRPVLPGPAPADRHPPSRSPAGRRC